MKKVIQFSVILVALASFPRLAAYDFERDGIYYNILSQEDQTVEVTSPNIESYSGDIIIPSHISDGAKTYRVTSIGDQAFYFCTSMSSVTIPASVTSIGSYAFKSCVALSSVTIPVSVTSIGSKAFMECSALTSVTIPASVTEIGNQAFKDCVALKDINVSQENPTYASVDGILYDKNVHTLLQCPGGRINDVIIPNLVTSIGDGAFYNCWALASVTIPASVTTIGDQAFMECDALANVTIPVSVTTIGGQAFMECDALKDINVSQENSTYASVDGILYDKDIHTLLQCPGGRMNDVIIPNLVTSIGDGAFYNCWALTSVTIPASVTTIGDQAFCFCSALNNVVIPGSVITIGDSAFQDCTALTNVTISASVTTIGDYAFKDCEAMNSVTIPTSVTSIGKWAFSGCDALTSVTIPASVTFIGEMAFTSCDALEDINVSQENPTYASVDGILYDKDVYTLIQCPGGRRNDVIIPHSVISIGIEAFSGCAALTSVTIPVSVTSIDAWAFAYCQALTTIYCRMTEPIECSRNLGFPDNVLKVAILYVPRGCREKYEKTKPWKKFWNIEEMDYSDVDEIAENGVESICVENGRIVIGGDALTEVFNLQGTCVYHGYGPTVDDLSPGIYIVKNGDRIVKIRL